MKTNNLPMVLSLIIFPIILGLISCSTIRDIENKQYNITREVHSKKFKFKFSNPPSQKDIDEVLVSFNTYYNEWEKDFNTTSLNATVYFFWVYDLEPVLNRKDTFDYLIGFATKKTSFYDSDVKIYLIAGLRNEVPATYHELCHVNETSIKYGFDSEHKDPMWHDWNIRSKEIAREILFNR